MDKAFLFYVKLLGVKEHFTQNELKAAYHENAEKYHPDKYANAPEYEKQHALDIMRHINEAYEYLKLYNIEKDANSIQETYYEKDDTYEIFIDDCNMLLKYSLSENIEGIEQAIKARTKQIWHGNSQNWQLNTELSEKVKNLMNKYNVNYSMTTYIEYIEKRTIRFIIVNRRRGDQWFICQGIADEMKNICIWK
jgi:hypothetical protein